MKKSTKNMLMVGALMMGGIALMKYKKDHPDCIHDMMDMAKDSASNMLTKLENMD